ncbi:hypothetical protein FSC37_00885 [Piscinibacter aquaticus]|uniref:Uncharacterized protein n=1 Tax=Piscinibacter aquaticus TaxID=392597 RepID=A0A5C6TY73_9BURK|nr:hypothetical protein FSC37_00885 [Piscinibacter aquaticus]
MPEAHANLGFALLGLQQPDAARVAFERAIAFRPAQANAYYGLALAQESLGDLELALGAMRSYLHLGRSESEDHQRRARAALWGGKRSSPSAAGLAALLHRAGHDPLDGRSDRLRLPDSGKRFPFVGRAVR